MIYSDNTSDSEIQDRIYGETYYSGEDQYSFGDDMSSDGEASNSDSELNNNTIIKPAQAVKRIRVKPYIGIDWDKILRTKGFESLAKFDQDMTDGYVSRKLTPQLKDYMDRGIINSDALKGAVNNTRTAIGQIVRWLRSESYDEVSPFKVKYSLESLARTKVYKRWHDWALRHWDQSPQTPLNKTLGYQQLLRWMLTRKAYTDIRSKINKTMEVVRNDMSGLKRRVDRWKFQYGQVTELVKTGHMLTGAQIIELNRKVWDEIVRGIDKIKNNLDRSKPKVNLKLAFDLQCDIQIILLLRLVGQRREVVAGLDDTTVELMPNGTVMITPQREKKVRATGHGIPVDDQVRKLLNWFQDHIRPLLRPKAEIRAFWISTKGTVQDGKHMTRKIQRHIAKWFPGTHITPASLRRQYATMFESADYTADMDQETFWQQLAQVMNTGVETLNKHYKRVKKVDKQADLIKKLNWDWNQDEGIENLMDRGMALMESDEELPDLPENPVDDIEYEVGEIIGKLVTSKGLKYLVRWEGYGPDDATWERLTDLEGALEEVEKYEIKVANLSPKSKKKPKKKAPKKRRVIEKKKPKKKKNEPKKKSRGGKNRKKK
jgi:hypothetical protein